MLYLSLSTGNEPGIFCWFQGSKGAPNIDVVFHAIIEPFLQGLCMEILVAHVGGYSITKLGSPKTFLRAPIACMCNDE